MSPTAAIAHFITPHYSYEALRYWMEERRVQQQVAAWERCQSPFRWATSQARAARQSRFTVVGEMSSTWAVSLTERPA